MFKLKPDQSNMCQVSGCEDRYFNTCRPNIFNSPEIRVCEKHYDEVQAKKTCRTKNCNNYIAKGEDKSWNKKMVWKEWCSECLNGINVMDKQIEEHYKNMGKFKNKIDKLNDQKYRKYGLGDCYLTSKINNYDYDSDSD